MKNENNSKEKIHQIKISREYNEKLEFLLNQIKESEPLARVKKRNLVEYSIEQLTQSDALSIAKRCINPKARILEYLKNDKDLNNPEALIALLKDQNSMPL